ncbi:MAG: hypothetical protein K2M00_09775, partial [Muribaculaceae bacterium]|nr:hypothetical protein [Muribaculaceae bacterium]
VGCALWLLYSLGNVFDQFKYAKGGTTVMLILLIILIIAIATFSVMYWFKRATQVNSNMPANSRFFAIPAVANLLRCLGEFCGIVVAGAGAYISLFTAIFASDNYFMRDMATYGLLGIVVCPIIGYIIVVVSRFFSESILAIASIANDTRELATFNPAN